MTGKETDKGIFCLFSVANNYDQPENNLVRFWFNKPSIEELSRFLGLPLDKAQDEQVVKVVSIWQGIRTLLDSTGEAYRLQYVEEGTSP